MSNLPAHHNVIPAQHPAVFTRRERRQLQTMEADASLELVSIQLRQALAQSSILSETAVTHTAMASAAGTAAAAEVWEKAAPRAAGVLALLEARHGANLARRIDDFSQGRH
jgi:hypothetical protein